MGRVDVSFFLHFLFHVTLLHHHPYNPHIFMFFLLSKAVVEYIKKSIYVWWWKIKLFPILSHTVTYFVVVSVCMQSPHLCLLWVELPY